MTKEYIDLECNAEWLDLTCKQFEKVIIKSNNLKRLYLTDNNSLEEISLDCPNLEWLDLDNNKLKEITLECLNLEFLRLNSNNLEEITLKCPNLKDLWLANNPHATMKISLTDCARKQHSEKYLKDFFEDVSSPLEEEILVFKVVTGYECPWAYALTRRYYN